MAKLDPSDDDLRTIGDLVNEICGILDRYEPPIQTAVLGELLAIWLAVRHSEAEWRPVLARFTATVRKVAAATLRRAGL